MSRKLAGLGRGKWTSGTLAVWDLNDRCLTVAYCLRLLFGRQTLVMGRCTLG